MSEGADERTARLREIKSAWMHMLPSDDGFEDIDWLLEEVESLAAEVGALRQALQRELTRHQRAVTIGDKPIEWCACCKQTRFPCVARQEIEASFRAAAGSERNETPPTKVAYEYAKSRVEDYQAGRLSFYGKEAIAHDRAIISAFEAAAVVPVTGSENG